MYDDFWDEEEEEALEILREWRQYVLDTFGKSASVHLFKNPTREFILKQREHMAELGTECTPDEVAALLRLISDTMDMD